MAKDPPLRARPVVAASASVKPIGEDRLAITWIGHSTFLLQIGGRNVLTDPIWSDRASPVSFIGPRRRTAPGMQLADLPEIHVVVLSHDHYDHLDASTIRTIVSRHSVAVWLAPLGVGKRLRRLGARDVHDLDWWQSTSVSGVACDCVPARHWSGRSLRDRGATLWCGWVIGTADHGVYFAGDTAWHPELARIAARASRLDAVLLPIGGYEPSWYMRHVHMSPEEAVQAYEELAANETVPRVGRTIMVPMHWGAFKLADEAMTEPPERLRESWIAAGLPPEALWIARPGETRAW